MSFIDDLFKSRKGPDIGRKMRGDTKKSYKTIDKLGKKQPKFDMSEFDKLELQDQLEAEELQKSALENIQLDPRMKQANMDVLQQLRDRGMGGGLSDSDLAMLRSTRREEDARNAAQQRTIASEMAQRGANGSGAELQARLLGQQSTAQNAAEAADRQVMAAAQAKQQALGNMSNLATQMEGTDWARQAQVADAEDSRQKFNLGTRMDVQQQNLGERQRIADANVGLSNEQQKYLNAMRQQKYDNKAGLAAQRIGVNNAMAGTRKFQPEQRPSAFDDALNYGGKIAGIAGDVYSMGATKATRDAMNAYTQSQQPKPAQQSGYQSTQEEANRYQGWNNPAPSAQQSNAYMNNVFAQDRAKASFAQPRMEDGGVMYAKDGGCASNYEDGGVEYYSDGSGDIVNSGEESYANDRVDAKINDGEMILNVAQQQRLMDLIKGKESLNDVPDEPLVEGVPESYQKELTNLGKQSKMTDGLKKLLSILGE